MNVLITSASRKVSLVRSFQSALAASGGGNVVAVDVSPYAPALYFADQRFLVSLSTDPGFIDEILDICKSENIALVIPTRDEELSRFAEARGRFARDGVRIAVAEPETVRLCADKLAFVAFCREHGFGIPRTYEYDEWSTAELPLFIKPRVGKGSQEARRVTDGDELRPLTDDPGRWVIQEYVAWPEYTIDVLADFEGRILSAVSRRRQLVVSGESYVSRTIHDPGLVMEAARLATEMRLVGHNTIQCFWNGERAKFIEVNPRFGGAAALGIAAGADTPSMLIRLVRGEIVSPVERYQSDLVMLRFTEDIFLKSDALLSRAEIPVPRVERSFAKREHRAVLFDLDNTFYLERDFVISGFRVAAGCLATRHHLDADEILLQMFHILDQSGRGRVFNILLEELKIDAAIWLPILLHVYRSHRPAISLLPGTALVLNGLKNRGIKLALVTDGLATVQKGKIAALGLEAYMDAIICTDELGQGYSKPSVVPFEVALTLLDVSPKNSAYVADDLSKDFVGPNLLGMKSAQILVEGLLGVRQNPLPTDPNFQPTVKAGSLKDALALLEI